MRAARRMKELRTLCAPMQCCVPRAMTLRPRRPAKRTATKERAGERQLRLTFAAHGRSDVKNWHRNRPAATTSSSLRGMTILETGTADGGSSECDQAQGARRKLPRACSASACCALMRDKPLKPDTSSASGDGCKGRGSGSGKHRWRWSCTGCSTCEKPVTELT